MCTNKTQREKFDVIVKLVQDHLNPNRNEAMERCKFQSASQRPTESIAEYIARLKELTLHCNYTDLKNALRGQLVTEVHDHQTQVALFSEEGLTYDKAVSLATTREIAVKNAASTGNQHTTEARANADAAESSVEHLDMRNRSGIR